MSELVHREIPTEVYLTDETFGWAFEEGLTIAPNPPDIRQIVEATAPAGGHDPSVIASRGLMLILCGGPYTRLGRVPVDNRWDSSSDQTPYFRCDELWKPDRTQTVPELKDHIAAAKRAARFELVVDKWDRHFGRMLAEQITARRTSGNPAQIIGQELLGAWRDSPLGKHRRQREAAFQTVKENNLQPFLIGRREA